MRPDNRKAEKDAIKNFRKVAEKVPEVNRLYRGAGNPTLSRMFRQAVLQAYEAGFKEGWRAGADIGGKK